jgi:hypothetical protein
MIMLLGGPREIVSLFAEEAEFECAYIERLACHSEGIKISYTWQLSFLSLTSESLHNIAAA